jgi:hypothetical protein
MKFHVLIILINLIPYIGSAQKSDSISSGYGFALNSGYNTEVDAIGFLPGAFYHRGKSQFELGVGLYPFVLKDQRIVSGEFNAFTNSKRTENPYKNYIGTQELFDKIGMYLDFQLNVGYRF